MKIQTLQIMQIILITSHYKLKTWEIKIKHY